MLKMAAVEGRGLGGVWGGGEGGGRGGGVVSFFFVCFRFILRVVLKLCCHERVADRSSRPPLTVEEFELINRVGGLTDVYQLMPC